jgi:hypothetical protein
MLHRAGGLQNQVIANSKADIRRSMQRGPARNASCGARWKALYLVAIAAGCDDQLDLSWAAGAVIDQDRRPGSKLAFHRFFFDHDLGAANTAHSECNDQNH